MIKVEDLKMSYGKKEVLKGISFEIKKGQTVGFLGANGEGKSTTMNLLTGYLIPTSGSVRVCDFDMINDPKAAKANIGYLPEIPPLYKDMRVIEYLEYVAALKKIRDKKTELSRVLGLFDLIEKENDFIKHLSKGYCQRLGFAAALLGDPVVLILDEPFVGLDPSESKKIREVIKDLKEDHCIMISSHILSEIEELCNEILIIKDGMLVLDESKASIKKSGRQLKYKLTVKGDKQVVLDTLNNNSAIDKALYVGESEKGVHDFEISTNSQRDIRDNIIGGLTSRKCTVYGISRIEESLEDVFTKINDQEGVKE